VEGVGLAGSNDGEEKRRENELQGACVKASEWYGESSLPTVCATER
jgi:hypothetical protein